MCYLALRVPTLAALTSVLDMELAKSALHARCSMGAGLNSAAAVRAQVKAAAQRQDG